MRCRIAWQDPDMHPHALFGYPHEPCHRRADEMRAAWCRVDAAADAGADRAAVSVLEIAVDIGAMILVLLKHVEASLWSGSGTFAGRNRRIDHDFVSHHEIGALFGNGNANVRIIRREPGQETGGNINRLLTMDQFVGLFHLRAGPARIAFS